MTRTETRYFCDICGNEFLFPDLHWIKTGGNGCGCIIDQEICRSCHDAITELIDNIPVTNVMRPSVHPNAP